VVDLVGHAQRVHLFFSSDCGSSGHTKGKFKLKKKTRSYLLLPFAITRCLFTFCHHQRKVIHSHSTARAACVCSKDGLQVVMRGPAQHPSQAVTQTSPCTLCWFLWDGVCPDHCIISLELAIMLFTENLLDRIKI
jgi:hypothetical protein